MSSLVWKDRVYFSLNLVSSTAIVLKLKVASFFITDAEIFCLLKTEIILKIKVIVRYESFREIVTSSDKIKTLGLELLR